MAWSCERETSRTPGWLPSFRLSGKAAQKTSADKEANQTQNGLADFSITGRILKRMLRDLGSAALNIKIVTNEFSSSSDKAITIKPTLA